MDEIECAYDPDCGADGSDSVYEWLENNYADKILSLDPTEDKYGFKIL